MCVCLLEAKIFDVGFSNLANAAIVWKKNNMMKNFVNRFYFVIGICFDGAIYS